LSEDLNEDAEKELTDIRAELTSLRQRLDQEKQTVVILRGVVHRVEKLENEIKSETDSLKELAQKLDRAFKAIGFPFAKISGAAKPTPAEVLPPEDDYD